VAPVRRAYREVTAAATVCTDRRVRGRAAVALPSVLARVGLLALLAAIPAGPAGAFDLGRLFEQRPPPDALWQIVSTCLGSAGGATPAPCCTCPAFARSCCDDPATPDAAVLWAETPEFVAIRDMRMCGCEPGFVAGLALPRTRVSGIEDPARPERIWSFAWAVARERIADPLEIGLVINPEGSRSQNQLHVHMLRLAPGMRRALDGAAASGRLTDPIPAALIRLPDLDHVFASVAAHLGTASLGAHGILVASSHDGGFLAAITDRRSPQRFTQNRCRG
jgi:CDP-diacylglycerol pyrophosphatase